MNSIKSSLRSGATSLGIFLGTGAHVVAKIAGCTGFDWCLLDMEHGLGSEDDALRQIQELNTTRTVPLVRIPANESYIIKRYLDFGAAGIMVPLVSNAAEAQSFVAALRYPPRGIRGLTTSSRASRYGFDFDNYFKNADRDILGIVQIETPAAVKNIDRIAAIDGVDVLFIGHSDLSMQLGCAGDFTAPLLLKAEAKVLAACKKHAKIAGMLCRHSINLQTYTAKGFRFIAMGTDIGCLKSSFNGLLKQK